MQLQQASRKKAKIRLGLSSVSGGGKTYSALLIAKGITDDLSKVAIIDTENGSADLYSHLGPYNVLILKPPFTPEAYIQAVKVCENAGMEVIIIDSITQEWEGKGGCLEIQESLGGKYQDWAKVTPRHRAFIDAVLQSPCHIITTVRRKQDYDMVKDNNGRTKVEKLGLKEVTREGFEYELTINLELDIRHNATASKDRTGLFMNKPAFVPSEDTGKAILQWCNQGIDVPGIEQRINACKTIKELLQLFQDEQIKDDDTITAFSNRRKELEDLTLNNFVISQAKMITNGISGATINRNK